MMTVVHFSDSSRLALLGDRTLPVDNKHHTVPVDNELPSMTAFDRYETAFDLEYMQYSQHIKYVDNSCCFSIIVVS